MFDALGYGFMQRALAAGLMVALVSGYYGSFIVQRGMSFLGSGLAHAAFGGVALALLLNQEPLWVAIPFTVLTALAITWLRDHTDLSADTVIGMFFALAMALGVIFLSRLESQTVDAYAYLFGSILSVAAVDLWATAGLVVVTALALPLWGRWAYATADEEAARADRLPVRLDNYLLSVLIAIVVVVAAKIVGIVLVSAFLVIPAAAARLVSARFLTMTLAAVTIAVVTAAVGLLASYHTDTPSGATIVVANCVAFGVCWAVSVVGSRRSSAS